MRLIVSRSRWYCCAALAACYLSACGGDDGTDAAAAAPGSSPPPSANPPASGGNRAPTISGTPAGSTLLGRQYSFAPTASDPDGNALTFSITGRPGWATFDTATGRLYGTPTQGDIGTSANIVIGVTDGSATTNLPAFSIQVVATATGSATITWSPPTQNSDGSPLANLASYRVYYGTSPGNYSNSAAANNGVASFVVDQLTPATWYFVVTAVNSNGVESAASNVATKTVM